MIRPVPHIAAMSGYALADLNPPKGKPVVSLSQNESLRPPSPTVIADVAQSLSDGHLYPDPDWTNLRRALAESHGLSERGILCASGSMELIFSLAQAYSDESSAVLAPAHAYPFFNTAARLARARFDTAPEDEGQVSVDALLEAVRPDTGLLFIANPGNPTGTRISRAELVRLRKNLPEEVLLVIDEAYGEFADHLNEPMFDLVARGDTVVLRTFSKAYGLAGFRVGWGVFPELVAAEIRKVMNPNNISIASQVAATAALNDQVYMRETCRQTVALRDKFAVRLRGAGFDVPESITNFVLIRFASSEAAGRADRALRAEGVFLRPQGGANLGHCLRATIADADSMAMAGDLLETWVREDTS